jgi:hypothetical protein
MTDSIPAGIFIAAMITTAMTVSPSTGVVQIRTEVE